MADLEKTVRIIFSGRDDMSKTVGGIAKSLDAIETSVSSVTKPLADLADDILKIEAAFVALATGGLTVSVLAAKDFDSQFREITTLIDDTGESVDQFREDIKEYASGSTQSIGDINAAIYEAISRYTEYGDAIAFVSKAEELAVGGKADLVSTTKLLAGVLSAYGEQVEATGRYSDVFFKIVKEGGTTLPEVAGSLASLMSLAAPLDVEIQQLGAGIATLTSKSMPTTEAMTALQGILTAIIKPSEQAKKMAAELGIEFSAAGLKAKGLDGFLGDIYTSTGGNVEQLAQLFGRVTGLAGVMSAFGKDGGDLFREKLEAMQKAGGAAATAFEKMKDDINLVNQNVVNNIQLTLTAIGDQVLGSYGDIAGSVTEIFKALSQAVTAGTFDDIFDAIREEASGLSDFLKDIATALPDALSSVDWSEFVGTSGGLIGKVKELFAALFPQDLSTQEGITGALQSIVNLGSLVNTTAGGIIDAFRPLIEVLGDVLRWFEDSPDAAQDWAAGIGETLGSAKIHEVIKERFGFWGALGAQVFLSGYTEFAERESKGQNKYFGWVEEAGENFSNWWATYWGSAEGKQSLEKLPESLAEAAEETKSTADLINDDISGIYASLNEMDATLSIDGADLIDWTDAANEALDGVKKEAGATKHEIGLIFDEETQTYISINPDPVSLDKAQKEIEEKVPAEKLMRIQADLDIAQIKAEADTIQAMVEWQAKLDIANVEAATKNLETMFKGISDVVTSTGDVISAMMAGYLGATGLQRLEIEKWIKKEYEMREKAAAQQAILIDQQIRLNDLKLEALTDGESLINISAEGLEPDLEMILWKIIERVQIRANAAGSEFLLGI